MIVPYDEGEGLEGLPQDDPRDPPHEEKQAVDDGGRGRLVKMDKRKREDTEAETKEGGEGLSHLYVCLFSHPVFVVVIQKIEPAADPACHQEQVYHHPVTVSRKIDICKIGRASCRERVQN